MDSNTHTDIDKTPDNVSITSKLSEASCQTVLNESIDYCIDDDDDPRLMAIFGTGMVVRHIRSTDKAEVLEPKLFKQNLVAQQDKIIASNDFNQVQTELAVDSIANISTFTSVIMKLDAQCERLTDSIPDSQIKGYITLKGAQTMKVPKIKTEFVNSVNERVKIIIEETLTCLKAVYDFQSSSTTLDTVGTYSTLFNKYYRALYKVHNHEARTLYSHFMMLSELSSCKDKSEDKLYQILEKKIVTSPPDSDSMFVRDSDLAVTAAERAASFIVPNVFAGNVDAHYNLRYLQLEQLRDAIYHYDPGWRLEARVNLLASLPGHLRSEVINQPLRILTHALREHLFSRD